MSWLGSLRFIAAAWNSVVSVTGTSQFTWVSIVVLSSELNQKKGNSGVSMVRENRTSLKINGGFFFTYSF